MRRATLSAPPVFAVAEREPGRVTLRADAGQVAHVFVLEEDVVRLLLLVDGTVTSMPSWAIAPGAGDIAEPGRDRMATDGFALPGFALTETPGQVVIETARIRLTITLHGFHCVWEQRVGGGWRTMAADRPTQAYDFGWWDGRTYHYVARQPGERHYGLGERAGAMDRSGRRFRLTSVDPMGYDAETSDPLYKTIPYVLTAQDDGVCHGAFYDTLARVTFDFGQEMDNYHGPYRHMVAESGDLDLYMIAGPDPAAVTRRFTWLTGKPALPPRWSLGYSGSTMTYTDAPDAQARMADFITGLETHDIGCGSFHLSSGYTSIGDKRYVFHWNRDKFPDPAGFAAGYAAAGVRLVANIKPAMLLNHPRIAEVRDAGLLVADADGVPTEAQFWDAPGVYLDFTNPATAAWWRGQVTTALLDHGIAATWNDNNEYEVWDARARIHGFGSPRPAADALPLHALLMMRASRAAQVAHAPGVRPYVVTRSGMAGLQRYGQTWSGDNRTEWKTLRYNLKMGLGLALSGVSNSGHDVGGFSGPAPDAELLVRWVQAGVLMPRFSIHSWNDDRTVNEPWMHADALPAIRRLMALRQTLVPFLYDLLHRYTHDYAPVLRPLWLDHPEDAGAWIDGDDHMIGRDVLAAIVVEPDAREREVRLPGQGQWYAVWSGAICAGGSQHRVPAPLDGPPLLFARAGSGMFVNLARGGFRSGAVERGVWLFPPVGAGRFDWDAYEDADGEGADRAPDRWQIQCVATDATVAMEVSVRAIGGSSGKVITIVLPVTETRAILIHGGSVECLAADPPTFHIML
ncbi:TIM-barrel domain-containing protein [Sphingomonas sp. CARO-RG-8B-R24-01]|uniref:glycoside hydrolase family 31 protein n=1 Tax=Sphingomonas sp. CARO-RG-8B-R24-01 TaxID=2914831 RepID=UPI001F588BA1|nr:TIM-barrel domain-containing protein [Sphingomonas sp. CARO-RG-8B-R24-01]